MTFFALSVVRYLPRFGTACGGGLGTEFDVGANGMGWILPLNPQVGAADQGADGATGGCMVPMIPLRLAPLWTMVNNSCTLRPVRR